MLPGAHRISRAGRWRRAGQWEIIWYAWRTSKANPAPVLWQCCAPSKAAAELLERDESQRIAGQYGDKAHPRAAAGYISALIADFKDSDAWKDLAPKTQKLWGAHLDEIRDVFGDTSLRAIEAKGSRKLIKDWHRTMAETPRKANTALTVLVRLFEYGLDVEDLTRNPAKNVKRLGEGDGRAGIVWTQAEFDRLLAVRHPETVFAGGVIRTHSHAGREILGPARKRALRLAWLTGLRREDLIRLTWSEVDLDAGVVRRRVLKSRKKKRVTAITIDDAPGLRELLLECRQAQREAEEFGAPRSLTVITNEDGRPYKRPDGFSGALLGAFDRADIRMPPQQLPIGFIGPPAPGKRKHLHDLRGTRASILFGMGYTDPEAEGWFGWAPGSGAKMRGIYGDPETIALVAQQRKVRG